MSAAACVLMCVIASWLFKGFDVRESPRIKPNSILDRFCVAIRPCKACNYPNLKTFGWVSYDEVGVLYSGELGSRSEARASDLRSCPELW